MRRLLGPALAACLLTGCSGTPSADEVAERWPDSVGELSPAASGWGEMDLEDLVGPVTEVDFYELDDASLGLGPLTVLIISGEDALSGEDINQFRCELAVRMGSAGPLDDAYDGDDGLHGTGGGFSVNADGVGVVVNSTLDPDQAREVAEALGGEDEDIEPCAEPDPGRLTG